MKIIRYRIADDMTVEFQDEYKYQTPTTYCNFLRGSIRNPYDKTIFGVGYIGEGEHKSTTEYGKIVHKGRCYNTWQNIIARCYNEYAKEDNSAYYGICTICEEWKNHQNFAKWYYDNYYDIGTERMHIDKDVLVKGNTVYSPDTCIFLPQRINMIFMEKPKTKDVDLPNAVYRCAKGYKASYNGKSLGVFNTIEEAVEAHDCKMRIHIKEVTKEYKGRIPEYIYEALLRW